MPIDCWKTSSSTYANVNSPTKSLGKIVKYSSPKLTDYYIQMGRKIICQCICRCPCLWIDNIRIIDLFIFSIYGQRQSHWLISLINWQTTRDPLTYMYRLLTDNDRPINLFFLAFWRATTYPLTSLSRLQYSSPKLTDYYIQMGRKIICQCICRCPSIDEANGQWVCRCLPIHEKK
jgi:hypothetical protein